MKENYLTIKENYLTIKENYLTIKENYLTIKVIVIIILSFQNFISFANAERNENSTPSVQIYEINKKIFDLLYRQQIDFIKLYNERELIEAKSVNDYCFNIIMHLKGGMPERAINELHKMKREYPHIINLPDFYFSLKQYSQPKISSTLVGLYPDLLEAYLLEYLQYLHLEEKLSFEEILVRIDSFPIANKSINLFNSRHYDSRLHIKMYFYQWMGKEKEFVIAIFDSIKHNENSDSTLIYLVALRNLDLKKYITDLKQLAKFIKPEYSTDALIVAELFWRYNCHDEALHFYKIALNTDLTDVDYEILQRFLSNIVPREKLKQGHESRIIHQISELLIEMGRKIEAHAFMMKNRSLKNVSKKNYDFYNAGIVQGKTGITKIERKIKRARRKNKNNIEYWVNRSYYYEGRENYRKSEIAINKSIMLLTQMNSNDSLHLMLEYENLIMRRGRMLSMRNKHDIAIELYLEELKKAPMSSRLAGVLMSRISSFSKKNYKFDLWEPICWDYLKENEYWPDHLISRLLLECYPNEKDLIFARLYDLAIKHNQKAYWLAINYEVQKHYPNEAIELFLFVKNVEASIENETSWEKSRTKNRIDFINKTLTKLYIANKDFKSAELLLCQIEATDFILATIKNMVILSFQMENYDEFFRLWRIYNNTNISDFELLPELTNNRTDEYFEKYYQNIGELLPESYIPNEAFKIIKQKTEE